MTTQGLIVNSKQWKNISTELSLSVGVNYNIQDVGPSAIFLVKSVIEPGVDFPSHVLDAGDNKIITQEEGEYFWVKSKYLNSSLACAELERTTKDVSVQNRHSEIIDVYLSHKLGELTVLAPVQIDETAIRIQTDGHVPTELQHEYICLKEGTAFYQGKIISVVADGGDDYTLTLRTPFDFAFTTDGGCSINSNNLAVDGSATPIIFRVSPALLDIGTRWDIAKMSFAFLGDAVTGPDSIPDNTTFGAQDAIAKGIVLRHKNSTTKNIFTAATNQELKIECGGDLEININKNKNGFYSVDAIRAFNGQENNGATIRLESKLIGSGELQIIVQDDLSLHEVILANAQGEVVED